MKSDETSRDDAFLLDLARQAFIRQGIRYDDLFTERSPVVGQKFWYFIHHRAYGANWLLAGPSYCQIWWMAGAGVGSALVAAELAPAILQSPEMLAREYEDHMRQLMVTHEAFNWMSSVDRSALTRELIVQNTDRFILSNLTHLLSWAKMNRGPFAAMVSRFYSRFFMDLFVKEYCRVGLHPAP